MDAGSSNQSRQQQQLGEEALPLHLCFFLVILLMVVGFTWYINYESVLESIFDQVKLLLIVSPLVLLLVVHWISSDESGRFSYLIPLLTEKDSIHGGGGGGTPWGVGFMLALLLLMISFQSYFKEKWFPLLR